MSFAGLLFMGASVGIWAALVAVAGAVALRNRLNEEITITFRRYAADVDRIRNIVTELNDELANVFNGIIHSDEDNAVMASLLRAAEDKYSNLIMALLVASCRDNLNNNAFRIMVNDIDARTKEIVMYQPIHMVVTEVKRSINSENVDDNSILRIIDEAGIEQYLANLPM
jgi:hypothetical protein